MSETPEYDEYEYQWHENEWLLLIDVVIKGLWCFTCLGVMVFLIGMVGGGEAEFIAAMFITGLMNVLGSKFWQLIKREVCQLIKS